MAGLTVASSHSWGLSTSHKYSRWVSPLCSHLQPDAHPPLAPCAHPRPPTQRKHLGRGLATWLSLPAAAPRGRVPLLIACHHRPQDGIRQQLYVGGQARDPSLGGAEVGHAVRSSRGTQAPGLAGHCGAAAMRRRRRQEGGTGPPSTPCSLTPTGTRLGVPFQPPPPCMSFLALC